MVNISKSLILVAHYTVILELLLGELCHVDNQNDGYESLNIVETNAVILNNFDLEVTLKKSRQGWSDFVGHCCRANCEL